MGFVFSIFKLVLSCLGFVGQFHHGSFCVCVVGALLLCAFFWYTDTVCLVGFMAVFVFDKNVLSLMVFGGA